jgi:RNA polymerase sigma-70 factor, ECF subfamily
MPDVEREQMAGLGALFLSELAAPVGAAAVAPADRERAAALGFTIVQHHGNAAQTWRPVALELERYARHLGACVAGSPEAGPAEAVLGRLHTTDLYLACAVGSGAAGAVELFLARFLEPVSAAVMSIRGAAGLLDEVRQALHERLLVAADGAPRILRYAGRASLSTWVGVAAHRQALWLMRAQTVQTRAADRVAQELPAIELDPELLYLKTRYRAAFKDALSIAIERLPQRQRLVLRLHAVAGLTMARIGVMLKVDESTVSRWVQRARATILVETQRELGQRLGIQVAEVPSIARLVTSQLDVSLARLLAADNAADEPRGLE